MANVDLAVAYVPIRPSFEGLAKDLDKGLAPAAGVAGEKAGREAGAKMSGGITSGLTGLSSVATRQFAGMGKSMVESMGITKAIRGSAQDFTSITKGMSTGFINGMRSANSELKNTESGMNRFGRTLNTAWGAATRSSNTARNSITAFTSGVKGASTETSGFNGHLTRLGASVRTANTSFLNFRNEAEPNLAMIRSGVERLGGSVTGFGVQTGAVLGGIGTLVGGMAITGGIDRAMNIENAQAKLKGLGHDTGTVQTIMDNALASVKGTAFGLGDAATVAASAVASGIQPGQELQTVLTTVSNTAALAGTDMNSMGQIFNQVAAKGKVQGDELLQLSEAGVPALQFLAKETGHTTAEVQDMVSKGQISFDTFASAMQHGVGNAAFEMGKTTAGSFANMRTAISRLGAEAITPFTPLARAFFNSITAGADSLTAKVGPAFQGVADWITRVFDVVRSMGGTELTQNLVLKLGITPDSPVWGLMNNLIGGVRAFRNAWVAADGDVTSSGFPGFMEQVAGGARSVYDWFTNLSGTAVGGLVATITSLGASFLLGGQKVSEFASSLIKTLGPAGAILERFIPLTGIFTGLGGVLKILSGGWGILISLMVSAYTTSEPVRKVFADLWGAVTNLASSIWNALAPAFGMLSGQGGALSGFFETMVSHFGELLQIIVPVVTTIINQFAPAIGNFLGGAIKGAIGVIGGFVLILSKVTAFLWPIVTTVLQALAPAFEFVSGVISSLVNVLSGPLGVAAGIAGAVFGVLAGVISKVYSVVQFLWPAITLVGRVIASLTSPIGIAVTAVTALITGFTWAYQNVEWFRNGVQGVWQGIVGVFNWGVAQGKLVLAAFGAVFSWLYTSVILPVWNGIRTAVAGFISWFQVSALPVIQGALNTLGTIFSWLWNVVIHPIIRTALAVMTGVAAAVLTVVQIIVGILTAILAPVFTWLWNSVVKPVWGWIRGAISGFGSWFSTSFVPSFKIAMDGVGGFFRWLYTGVVKPVWDWITGAIRGFLNWFQTVLIPAFRIGMDVLGSVFRWLYESVVKPVWNGIKWFIEMTWNGIKAVFNAIKWVIDNVLAPVFRWFYNSVIKPVWNGIRWFIDREVAGVRAVFNSIMGFIREYLAPVFRWLYDNVIRPVWDSISKKIGDAVGWIRDSILRPLTDFIQNTFVEAWRKTQEGIGRAWDKLKEAVKEPIRIVVDEVINRFIGNYNDMNDWWKGDDIKKLELGFSSGGWTGPGDKYDIAGVVHADEFVISKSARRKFEAEHPGVLETINATGSLPTTPPAATKAPSKGEAYAAPPKGPGTEVWGSLQAAASQVGHMYFPKRSFMGIDTESAAKAWMGQSAMEIRMGNGSPGIRDFVTGGNGGWGFMDGTNIYMQSVVPQNRRRGVLIHEMGHALGLAHPAMGDSSTIMDHLMTHQPDWPSNLDYQSLRELWGEPGKDAKKYAYDGSGGGSNPLVEKFISMVQGMTDGWFDGASKLADGNKFLQMPIGFGKKMVDGVFSWLREAFGGSSESNDSEVASAQSVENWRPTIIDALGRAGLPQTKQFQDAWLRQVQSESGGNPNAFQHGYVDVNTGGNEAAGLLQVTKTTFEAYRDKSLPNNRFDPLASAVAGMRWAKASRGVDGILGYIGEGHGYANGGLVKPITHGIFDGGGIIDKGIHMVEHRETRPDYVLPERKWKIAERSLEAVSTTKPEITIHVTVPEREGIDPSQMGARIGESIAFELGRAQI